MKHLLGKKQKLCVCVCMFVCVCVGGGMSMNDSSIRFSVFLLLMVLARGATILKEDLYVPAWNVCFPA